jgi:hypothetical protein
VLPDSDAPHAGSPSRFNTCPRVLNDNAGAWLRSEASGRNQKDLWVGLSGLDIFGGHGSLKPISKPERVQDRFDIEARRGRRDSLQPSLSMQAFDPLSRSGKRRESLQAHELAVSDFFGIADSLDGPGVGILAEPLAQNRVVALAETREKILVGDRDSFTIEGFVPSAPMILLGVHEGSVKVPQNCAADL